MNEAQLHADNAFLTLTYDDDHLPVNRSLHYKHFQAFMKRLRKSIAPKRVRFFMCGEYGELNGRPHFHACLFGHNFADRVYYRTVPSGSKLYVSHTLAGLWPYGFSSIGDVTLESAGYVARYVLKKLTGDGESKYYNIVDPSTGEIHVREKEFCHMSLRPGIGAGWLDRYTSDVYPSGEMVVRGKKVYPPRYYDKRYKEGHPDEFEELSASRVARSRQAFLDNTDERLRVKEVVKLAAIRSLKRSLT